MQTLKRIQYEIDQRSGKLRFAVPFIEGASGKKYYWADTMSFDRLTHYEKLVPQIAIGLTIDEIFKKFRSIWEAANEQRFGEVCVHAWNGMTAINELEDDTRVHPVFEMVSLFLNAEDEDLGTVDKKMIKEKYLDIYRAYDSSDFFELAKAFIPGYMKVSEEATRATFLKEKTKLTGASQTT